MSTVTYSDDVLPGYVAGVKHSFAIPKEAQQQPLLGTECIKCMQEKVLAQVEKDGKKAKAAKPEAAEPKAVAKDTTKTAEKAETAVKAAKAEEEEEEDPVTTALNKYGIITENPWEKGVK